MEQALAYVILGTVGSGRREVLCDLLSDYSEEEGRPTVYLAESEPPCAHDSRLPGLQRWRFTEERLVETRFDAESRLHFFITEGRSNPVDQLESLRNHLREGNIQLARILCVVNCKLVELHPETLPWFDACIHFSDVVLLNKREGVPNKWISDFKARYEDQYFPCLFELVKQGRVKNPAMLLDPIARRISQAFDPGEEKPDCEIPEGTEFIDDFADDDTEGGEGGQKSPEEDEEEPTQEDPYFQRKLGGGRHKLIPDIRKFLIQAPASP